MDAVASASWMATEVPEATSPAEGVKVGVASTTVINCETEGLLLESAASMAMAVTVSVELTVTAVVYAVPLVALGVLPSVV